MKHLHECATCGTTHCDDCRARLAVGVSYEPMVKIKPRGLCRVCYVKHTTAGTSCAACPQAAEDACKNCGKPFCKEHMHATEEDLNGFCVSCANPEVRHRDSILPK